MKPRLVDGDFIHAAESLGCPVTRVKAVTRVEAKAAGFDDHDQPIVLFERHKFRIFTDCKFDDQPDISNKLPGGYTPTNTSEWLRVHKAMALDEKAAIKATSWGLFQLMGFNYASCGFDYPEDFMNAMMQSETEQLNAFVSFIKSERPLWLALQRGDAITFARGYNGPNYMVNKYDTKLKTEGF